MQRSITWCIQSKLEIMKKKVTCHCGEVELEVNFPDEGIGKVTRCNCSICKRKSAIMARVNQSELKVIKGKDKMNIFVLHPNNKVSSVQRKLMTTVEDKNVFNIACLLYTSPSPRD